MNANPSAAFARELVASLYDLGVRDFVLCPGSRSGPLAHALAEAGGGNPPLGAPRVDLHVRVDERSAAFVALGIARGRAATDVPRPVAMITTSGTAVGNLLPAVMEAHHSGVPLLLITADRPGEMRGVGANQTTDQGGIFATFARWSAEVPAPESLETPGRAATLAARAVAIAMGDPARDDMTGTPGPVHLNIEFREPLEADGGVWQDPPRIDPTPSYGTRVLTAADLPAPLPAVERGLVIAGDRAGDVAREVAEAHGWPLLAEPTSGARAGDACIGFYVSVLESDAGRSLAEQVHQVVVIGRPTLSRPIQQLIARAPSLIVAAHGARWREAPRHADQVVRTVPSSWLTRSDGTLELGDSAWLAKWREAASEFEDLAHVWGGDAVADAFMAPLGKGDVAVIGSSGPIRAVDRVGPVCSPGEVPTLIANRGLSGIDGTVSTAVGVALATGQPTHALMGDVTFLHDVGGLLIGPLEKRPRLRIVVANDGGGTIFGRLEHASAPAEHVERVFTTPHGVDIGAICAGYGIPHVAVRNADALARAVAAPPVTLEVVEARLPRA
ncbi:2-succinyl-5-enolpyruvyl-6-hydroxy-3-cyclohexene-1-carboxylic-acid synthase [Demequina muriae]|uniref:2-succinyl-5-enolpyruvyl-6-hydroxy-3-cyclohexene-1-carboxylate synthase n=1 Tax=Demequina muriae TaxID=3051664 RepID=A0ABT8GH56_9MICO|nr:2-succinyl-5-enolpyruvyl-6-hydroxy-3-cyclohexene-1-carboxylic-acid synthase [Demequina sp. EGI L300058]MDN4480755.1 2-succinyl-5-enolpyruvyl-6-hydroxy-3-cyclohexene-1-carboxylic-acid synthase [Demequina sp. EGI L300058]